MNSHFLNYTEEIPKIKIYLTRVSDSQQFAFIVFVYHRVGWIISQLHKNTGQISGDLGLKHFLSWDSNVFVYSEKYLLLTINQSPAVQNFIYPIFYVFTEKYPSQGAIKTLGYNAFTNILSVSLCLSRSFSLCNSMYFNILTNSCSSFFLAFLQRCANGDQNLNYFLHLYLEV